MANDNCDIENEVDDDEDFDLDVDLDANAPSDWLTAKVEGIRLHFHDGPRDGECVTVDRAGEYSFGRSGSSTWVFKNDPVYEHVSAHHALIRVGRTGVTLVNLAPKNGLLVFGEEVPHQAEIPLNDLDVFQLGRGGPRIEIRIGNLSTLAEQK